MMVSWVPDHMGLGVICSITLKAEITLMKKILYKPPMERKKL